MKGSSLDPCFCAEMKQSSPLIIITALKRFKTNQLENILKFLHFVLLKYAKLEAA